MGMEDKTEQATPEKRKEARKKGQVAKSADAGGALALMAGLFALKSAIPAATQQFSSTMAHYLGNLSAFPATPEGVHSLFIDAVTVVLRVVAPVLGTVLVAGLAVNVAQVGFFFNPQSLMPDFTRIDPMKGAARMVSPKSAMEVAKSLAKVGVMGSVVWAFLRNEQAAIISMGVVDRAEAAHIAGDLLWRLCMRACSVLLVIGGLDYVWQRSQFEKGLKMTKQEVKEEAKKSEGDPLIKSQIRQRHRQMAMKRMMQDVPKADVIVTNPTHYAVALKYDGATMAAPVVVAKGQDLIAQRIKEIARANGVPCIENRPVARALFAAAEVGHPVPIDMYQAVAEVLAFVYRLRPTSRRLVNA